MSNINGICDMVEIRSIMLTIPQCGTYRHLSHPHLIEIDSLSQSHFIIPTMFNNHVLNIIKEFSIKGCFYGI